MTNRSKELLLIEEAPWFHKAYSISEVRYLTCQAMPDMTRFILVNLQDFCHQSGFLCFFTFSFYGNSNPILIPPKWFWKSIENVSEAKQGLYKLDLFIPLWWIRYFPHRVAPGVNFYVCSGWRPLLQLPLAQGCNSSPIPCDRNLFPVAYTSTCPTQMLMKLCCMTMIITIILTSSFTTGYLVAQLVKNPSAMQETQVWFLGWEDLLEKG